MVPSVCFVYQVQFIENKESYVLKNTRVAVDQGIQRFRGSQQKVSRLARLELKSIAGFHRYREAESGKRIGETLVEVIDQCPSRGNVDHGQARTRVV
jgi:hypothetical protein